MKRHSLRSDGAGFYQLAAHEYSLSGTKIVKARRDLASQALSGTKARVYRPYRQS
ncbi:MAG TPA: hypothetical protein DCQ57_04100 [Enterobacteriaceae bacterium]|nr:DUF2575 domain-containing protein [Salmonella enterica subsp. enterica serovar Enteritidis]HAI48530.1 hypothetical protein [Enterobacteriaceae bacterium]HAP80744.1 hypothetical protein [Enterobacteriaceae bacterium]